MATRYFTPALFAFLKDLKANNNREWFKANQQRYEDAVRQPALDFITDFASTLEKLSPHFVADSRTVGGSLFRIQRDTRFSKDKTPYKLNTGVHFRHERAKDAHAPGFYVHLEPGRCFMGVGLWRPETRMAYQIRDHIDAEPAAWKKAAHAKKFSSAFRLDGDALKRPPKGFDPEHPLLDDLKRKDFIATQDLTQGQITRTDFPDFFFQQCKTAEPFMKFLCAAVDVKY